MIIFKNLKWSNAFSYGADNEISLSEVPLVQLIGKNGHGKTSIILVLEEVLFNKNSKGIPRSKVLNRYSKEKSYSITLEFEKDGTEYLVETKRGTTQTVKLVEDGIDISGHTATATYKLIEQVLGMDHKTFTQIVNQVSSSSLEFLSATDGNRKKFLIDLLKLEKYTKSAEVFKATAKLIEAEIAKKQAKIDSLEDLIRRNKATNLTILELVPVPSVDVDTTEIQELTFQLRTIAADNKSIVQNNKYKEVLHGLKVEPLCDRPVDNTAELTKSRTEYLKTCSDANTFISKMNALGTKCPTCLSEINSAKIREIVHTKELDKSVATMQAAEVEADLARIKRVMSAWTAAYNNQKMYEEYHALYNPQLPSQVSDPIAIQDRLNKLQEALSVTQATKTKAETHNAKVQAHNTKVSVLVAQIEEIELELPPLRLEVQNLSTRLANLQVLIKTFSNTGLVAYKIECLVKDLELLTNSYLTDLSGGKFQLSFEIAASDKLNVVINDNGTDIDISALSGGEKARVNVATLLGIRKLLQSLSNNRINLLFLDETIDSLDDDGKEKLVDILLKEEYLNTVIVSHGFQHPLIEKLRIIKTKNISRIEYG